MPGPIRIVPPVTARQLTPIPTTPPQLSYHGGHLLNAVEVYTIFWGPDWQQAPQSNLIGQLNQFFDSILTSSLLDLLAEYGAGGQSIGHGRRIGTNTITTSSPGHQVSGGGIEVTDGEIQQALQGWITNGTIPQPNSNTLYFVYLPPNVTSVLGSDRSCQIYCAYHDHIGGTIFYAVMPYITCSGCQFTSQLFSTLTEVSSHELCEAITDPNLNAWYDSSTGYEIGDICNGQVQQVNGFSVQAEWSNRAGACVVAPGLLFPWLGPDSVASGVSGNPSFIQGGLGNPGNFELVVPMASGGIGHYWRNNSDPNLPWAKSTVFGQGAGQVDAVCLIQGSFGSPGNFEVVARIGNKLAHFYRVNS